MEILQQYILGNSLNDYLLTFGFFFILVVIFKIIVFILEKIIKRLVEKTKTSLDDLVLSIVQSLKPPFYYFLAFYLASTNLVLNYFVDQSLKIILIIWIIFQIIQVPHILINYFINKNGAKSDDPQLQNAANFISIIAKIFLWSLGLLLILSNLGVDITSLIAGLGIGGVAAALALQNILGDLFSSLAIYLDKPFQPGDFIIINGQMGVVQKIGIKTTRIKALQGEELIIPNSQLISSVVQNFKQMKERRIMFTIGLTYNTPNEKLAVAPKIIEEIVSNQKNVRFDRSHVATFSDFSLNIETVYYLNSSEYNVFMDTQQAILLAIKEKFEKENMSFAFPTQTIHLEK